jgi:hypothetical protein
MKAIRRRLFILGLTWLGTGLNAPAAEPIRPEQFAKLQALIKPDQTEDEWSKIPWMTDLWQARQKAARDGKPILLWEMDGHPLGCT